MNGGINTYAYVTGNPVNFVDPLGLDISIEYTDAAGLTSFPSLTHQNIGVVGNNPRFSFGTYEGAEETLFSGNNKMPTNDVAMGDMDGMVYHDFRGENIHKEHNKILKTNKIMDYNVEKLLWGMVGFVGNYGFYDNTCIEFSEKMFRFFEDKQSSFSFKKYKKDELINFYNSYFNL